MSSDSATQLIGIFAFILIAGLIFYVFDRPRGRGRGARRLEVVDPGDATPVSATPGAQRREWLGEVRETASRTESAERAETRFRAMARKKLEPLLDEIIDTAGARGLRAAYDVRVDDTGSRYRLEVAAGMPNPGRPAPLMTLTRGQREDVVIVWGASASGIPLTGLPGPDAVRREMPWSQVDFELKDFVERAQKED
jgi:hypothetical protein